MPNAKDVTDSGLFRILAAGFAGGGKTTQIRSLPGRKFVYAFDPNCVRSLAGADIEYELFTPDIADVDMSAKPLDKAKKEDKTTGTKNPRAYVDWENHFEEHYANGYFKQFDWLCFDSFTTFAEILMDRILYLNGRLGRQPQQDDWAAQMQSIKNVFRVLTAMDINLYCTGHIQPKQDELTKKTYLQLVITGQLRLRLPMLFTDIWGLFCDSDDKGESFTMQTRPDRELPYLRSSVKGLEHIEDITIHDMANAEREGIGRILSPFIRTKA